MITDRHQSMSIRLPLELKAWLAARAKIIGSSQIAELTALLEVAVEADPLTKIKIVEDRGRYITTSAYTGERFRAYAIKIPAVTAATEALALLGRDASSLIDDTVGEAA